MPVVFNGLGKDVDFFYHAGAISKEKRKTVLPKIQMLCVELGLEYEIAYGEAHERTNFVVIYGVCPGEDIRKQFCNLFRRSDLLKQSKIIELMNQFKRVYPQKAC